MLRATVFETPADDLLPGPPAVTASVTVGVITQVRADAVAVASADRAEVFSTSPATVTWLGAKASPTQLQSGDPVVVRHAAAGEARGARRHADRIWGRIGRVTGTILDVDGREFLVDTRRHDQLPQRVIVPPGASRQIQVRFPRLAPGYLLDVIGTRHGDYLLASRPATAQPPYHAGHPPRQPPVSGPVSMPVSGSAVWHEPGVEPPGQLGLAYPAVEPEVGAAPRAGGGTGCLRLPYLSLGSTVRVRNDCAEIAAVLPVTRDGVAAREFCDRCVNCGTSPRGRVADLTMAAFVGLGGNLEDGCFNATLTTMVV